MTLTEAQTAAVARWLADGASLSDVQRRLREEFQLTLTYLDTRLLVADLQLSLKEPEPPAPAPAADPVDESPALPEEDLLPAEDALPAAPGGKVNVTIDQITKPGTLVSGRVTFSDGESAAWYLDQMGRLGLDPSTIGYRPSERDVLAFQVELQRLARAQGF